MKEFVVALLTNRFGIVLATLNVCYFVSRKAVPYVFEHVHGEKDVLGDVVLEKCFFSGDSFLVLTGMHLNGVMVLANLPALLLSLVSSKLITTTFAVECFFTRAKFEIAFILFFVTVQWLFIGWLAKTIALKIKS